MVAVAPSLWIRLFVLLGRGSGRAPRKSERTPCFVDTGETARVAEQGYFPTWHPYFRLGVREWVTADEEIGPQLQRLGLSPHDVRWVVLTHLHTDHAGGLAHLLPHSEFLVSRTELRQASGTLGTQDLMLDGIADGVTNDERTARSTLAALRALAHSRPTIYLPSHDPDSPRRLANTQPAIGPGSHSSPAPAMAH